MTDLETITHLTTCRTAQAATIARLWTALTAIKNAHPDASATALRAMAEGALK